MYHVRAGGNNPSYPNANGPVGEFTIAGVLAVGRTMGLQNVAPLCQPSDGYPLPEDSIPLHIWVILIFSILPLLMGVEIMRLMDRFQPRPLESWQRFLVWALILFTPPMWDSLIFYGHYEQPLAIWLGLVAVRMFQEGRFAVSGGLLSLAILCKSSSVFVIIPRGLLMLIEREWWGVVRFSLALAGVTLAFLLPFYLHDPHDLIFSLSGFRQYLLIGDGSFWTFFKNTPLETKVQSIDSTVGLILGVIASTVLILVGRVRRGDAAVYAVICAASICFPLSIKAVWGYYFADPIIWGLAWLVTRPTLRQRWWEPIFVTVCFSALMVITEYRITVVHPGYPEVGVTRTLALLESGTEAVALVLFVALLAVVLAFQRQPSAAPPKSQELSHTTLGIFP